MCDLIPACEFETNFAQKCHVFHAVYFQNKMLVSLRSSVKLYYLVLHIMSRPCDKFKSHQWNLFRRLIFVFQWHNLAIAKCFPYSVQIWPQPLCGQSLSVCNTVCSQKQIMHLFKMCICKVFLFVGQEVLCIAVTFSACFVLAFLWTGIAVLTKYEGVVSTDSSPNISLFVVMACKFSEVQI